MIKSLLCRLGSGAALRSPSPLWKIFEGNVSAAASATWKQFSLGLAQPSRLLHYSRANKYKDLMQTMSENSSRKAAAGLFSVTTVSVRRDEWIMFNAEPDKAGAFNKTIHPAAEWAADYFSMRVHFCVCARAPVRGFYVAWRRAFMFKEEEKLSDMPLKVRKLKSHPKAQRVLL